MALEVLTFTILYSQSHPTSTHPKGLVVSCSSWETLVFNKMGCVLFLADQLAAGETRSVECSEYHMGQFVSIYLDHTEPLTLCEVKVFGRTGESSHCAHNDWHFQNRLQLFNECLIVLICFCLIFTRFYTTTVHTVISPGKQLKELIFQYNQKQRQIWLDWMRESVSWLQMSFWSGYWPLQNAIFLFQTYLSGFLLFHAGRWDTTLELYTLAGNIIWLSCTQKPHGIESHHDCKDAMACHYWWTQVNQPPPTFLHKMICKERGTKKHSAFTLLRVVPFLFELASFENLQNSNWAPSICLHIT